MREELANILSAIQHKELPAAFEDLLGAAWDATNERFHVQETYVVDYKETLPDELARGYGAGIIRLAIAYYNSFGGIIVFGVRDRELSVAGVAGNVDIEAFNRALSDYTGSSIECLCKQYTVPTKKGELNISVMLVPRRGTTPPIRLLRKLDKYPPNILWVRDRHEVLEAAPRHLAQLYSDRSLLPSDQDGESRVLVHRSLPPSPATIERFINRGVLLDQLWTWFVYSDQPRVYLHGPGGSGKSTLAHEFAKQLTENGAQVHLKNGEHLDYVLYLSSKETELNTYNGQQQKFLLRQFSDVDEQIDQILHHSGMHSQNDETTIAVDKDALLQELFDNFSGLIVIDDIDALSRRGLDTGEELLFFKTMKGRSRNKILYTLRHPPSHAMSSSIVVPGLSPENEYFDFQRVCCEYFDVPEPPPEKTPHIMEVTSSLPLLIETLVGIRKHCSNYNEAIELFKDRGGEEARRYLYQREYDRLSNQGKSRYVLAGLYLLDEPITFTAFCGLTQMSPEHLKESLSEAGSIFISRSEDTSGETLYQLTPPSRPFIGVVSGQLPHIGGLRTRVKHYRSEGLKMGREEAAVIASMESLIKTKSYGDVARIAEKYAPHDPVMVNPKVQSLLGQAYSELGPEMREKARHCFKHAEGLGYRDIFMMRRWFNMELFSGYGQMEAERICRAMIEDSKITQRARSEFWSKLGACEFSKSRAVSTASSDKAMLYLRNSIVFYCEGMWVGQRSADFDASLGLGWLERPLHELIIRAGRDIEQFFVLIEDLSRQKHDIFLDSAKLIISYLTRSPVTADEMLRAQLRGFASRTIATIKREIKNANETPGFGFVLEALNSFKKSV
ncbi:AAA ATPase domain [Hoeflea sp. IMCC20628]|uniref:AAA family ATPase n=1 Tax=Hoeflea sp. IMCC20628 TaxID=1620421 RepID=UPI00063AC366|nr:AAA family ATPase [Hoeflea sp. IMCC20628]AKI02677.1 AAA ATPase domain [Hoeflea sp. IMCC20628]